VRQIPASGINLFQLIYILIREYTEKTGLQPLNLSLGNPDGVPGEELRALKAKYSADPAYEYHTYAEDKNINGFAEAMVESHGGVKACDHPHLKILPTAGIKTATALLPLACGLHNRRGAFKVVSNLPAYDVIGTWSGAYLGAERTVWPLMSADGMRLNVRRLPDVKPDLVHVIRPGNPAAVGAAASDWRALIEWCLERKARLVNDAAYAALVEGGTHVSLASVAKDYPELEWLELYSVSKSFNDPGARLGALIGSRDFVDDYIMIKGNTDSGPVPSVMAAYGEYLRSPASKRFLSELRFLYKARLDYIIPKLNAAGLEPACTTQAGFFTLWRVPKQVLGRKVDSAEAFNRLVISELGLVGVHFQGGDGPLIRYAVCADVLAPAFKERFEKALAKLKPVY
jgi:aspartate/methionine/tyrosine aminotransferase